MSETAIEISEVPDATEEMKFKGDGASRAKRSGTGLYYASGHDEPTKRFVVGMSIRGGKILWNQQRSNLYKTDVGNLCARLETKESHPSIYTAARRSDDGPRRPRERYLSE